MEPVHIQTPYPEALETIKKKKNVVETEELLEIFKQVQINIPLLEAVKHLPACTKFLKDAVHPSVS